MNECMHAVQGYLNNDNLSNIYFQCIVIGSMCDCTGSNLRNTLKAAASFPAQDNPGKRHA